MNVLLGGLGGRISLINGYLHLMLITFDWWSYLWISYHITFTMKRRLIVELCLAMEKLSLSEPKFKERQLVRCWRCKKVGHKKRFCSMVKSKLQQPKFKQMIPKRVFHSRRRKFFNKIWVNHVQINEIKDCL